MGAFRRRSVAAVQAAASMAKIDQPTTALAFIQRLKILGQVTISFSIEPPLHMGFSARILVVDFCLKHVLAHVYRRFRCQVGSDVR